MKRGYEENYDREIKDIEVKTLPFPNITEAQLEAFKERWAAAHSAHYSNSGHPTSSIDPDYWKDKSEGPILDESGWRTK